MKRWWNWAAWLLIAAGAAWVGVWAYRTLPPPAVDPPVVALSEYPSFRHQGKTYIVRDGGLLLVDPRTGRLDEVVRLYEKNFYSKHFRRQGQTLLRIDPATGQGRATLAEFAEDFEAAGGVSELLRGGRWTSLTLQSPAAKTIAEYTALARSVVTETAGFRDNRVEPSDEQAHSGRRALRCHAAGAVGLPVSKASLGTGLLHLRSGDEVSIEAWFYLAEGRPTGLLDLESRFIVESPGMRILLGPDRLPRCELKWGAKPTYRPDPKTAEPFPKRRWTRLRFQLRLSAKADGRVRLWQDDRLLIDAAGQTLPLAEAVYDNLEIGVTANDTPQAVTLLVDDVRLGDAVPPPK